MAKPCNLNSQTSSTPMAWAPVFMVVFTLLAVPLTAGAQPLRTITPITTPAATGIITDNAAETDAATAAAMPAAVLDLHAAEAAAAAAQLLPPAANDHQLPESINTTDPASPNFPLWPGAMQYLSRMAANASFQTQDTAAAAARGFVVRNGTQLYRNGKPFHFVGGNAYWLVDFYTMSWGRDKIDEFFDSCQALGVHVIRTWMFNIGLPKSRATYDSREPAGLDYIIWSAKQRGLMLVFTLGNSWNAYKGPEQFVQMATGTAEKKDILDFNSDTTTAALYKLHIWGLISRVNPLTGLQPRHDPTIFSWNILNEPRCPGCMSSSQQLIHQGWLSDMAQFLRAADPLHLISAATEGFFVEDHHTLLHFYNPGPGAQCDGEDWFKISTIPEVDYTTIHVYERHMELLPRPSGHDLNWPNWIFCGWDCYVNWFKNYVGLHLFLSRSVLKKPLVVEEFGVTYFRMTLPQQRVLFKILLDMLTESAQSDGSLAGALFWNAARNDSIDSDGYNIQIDRPSYTLPASAITAPTDLPSTVVSADVAKQMTDNITNSDSVDVVFTSQGAPAALAMQMTEVLLPQAVVPKPAVTAVPHGVDVPSHGTAAGPADSNADVINPVEGTAAEATAGPAQIKPVATVSAETEPISGTPVVTTAPRTKTATNNSVDGTPSSSSDNAALPQAVTAHNVDAAAISSSGYPASSIPGFTSNQAEEAISTSATGRRLLKDTITPMAWHRQQTWSSAPLGAVRPSVAFLTRKDEGISDSNGWRRLLVVQDHLDAFRRAGWRAACADQAAKTWRPYKLFNITDTVSDNPMYDQLLAGGDVVGVISEATAKVHQQAQPKGGQAAQPHDVPSAGRK